MMNNDRTFEHEEDRLLAAADPSAVLLGVAYPFQMVEDLPSEPHDIRLTDVVVAEGCA